MTATRHLLFQTTMILATASLVAQAADQPQWGQPFTRNMISDERGLADTFEPGYRGALTGPVAPRPAGNVKWVAELGSQTYGTPVVAEGRVLVGTNNDAPRDKRLRHDAGVLMCFDEKSGDFLWQLVVPKLTQIRYGDFYRIGLTASPVVEGGLVYVVSNRAEVLCLDLDGLADGNGGPVVDEAVRSIHAGDEPVELDEKGADIVWSFDMVATAGVQPHNAANCSILSFGDHLYVCTSNGVNSTHSQAAAPAAPTLIVLDKKTGGLVAKDNFAVGGDLIHGQWSNPALARMGETVRIFQGAGNGLLYGCDPAPAGPVPPAPLALEKVWWANGHPAAQTQDTVTIEHGHRSKSFEIIGTPVFYNNRIYTAITQDPFHHHREGVLTCYKADGTGDVTRTNLVWSYADVGACSATVSIADGLVYVGGHDGRLHCLDAETGKPYWVHDSEGPIWGSTLVADGKVYVGTERRIFWILKHDKTPTVLARIAMPDSICSTPIAANGTLYVATAREMYAVFDPAAQERVAAETARVEQEAKKAAEVPPPQPTPAPEPAPAPQPVPEPAPAPAPEAVPEPAPKPETPPPPVATPAPEPKPEPAPAPQPEPKPEPAPTPAPAPEAVPEPAPKPETPPAPETPPPAPEPASNPEPAPQPNPTSAPAP